MWELLYPLLILQFNKKPKDNILYCYLVLHNEDMQPLLIA